MKDILIDIEYYLSHDYSAEEIANKLNIPLAWVTECEMHMEHVDYPIYEQDQ